MKGWLPADELNSVYRKHVRVINNTFPIVDDHGAMIALRTAIGVAVSDAYRRVVPFRYLGGDTAHETIFCKSIIQNRNGLGALPRLHPGPRRTQFLHQPRRTGLGSKPGRVADYPGRLVELVGLQMCVAQPKGTEG
jgi:hypothetical protein